MNILGFGGTVVRALVLNNKKAEKAKKLNKYLSMFFWSISTKKLEIFVRTEIRLIKYIKIFKMTLDFLNN
jgi:hypothetical protein